ncbi:MAG TPA: 3-deoxy-manno-octulosonate cytidylyltransferase [Candidatus Omnitrophica bacterium]|nr:MAG: 3-deoxy-manno-octulosonate cytidylyltransferase [Candidatus Omnitrophota bacterium]RKY45035.1 MAG: 3-deoxy-manno-octulosonate cytidylyltransferase [Candidatus Omnitrophota bacterium]HEC69999.1 3-deoxy-manno-octulosonate cytidylyltransferase [Candidatus Omnitrophota bacterium]
MEVLGVIPARLSSQRLPGKLLRKVLGKTILEWTWSQAKKAKNLEDLIIAVDCEELKKEAENFGAKVVLTSPEHSSGTERICEAVSSIDTRIVVNIQADEPLIHPSVIDSLVETMLSDEELTMATPIKEIEDEEELADSNIVKVVIDKDNFALYFSRTVIPFLRDRDSKPTYFKHLGIYAYTKDFLYVFKNLPPSSLEKAEKLEQLRVLEAGFKIKTVITNFDSYGVDTEEDLEKVERVLIEKGYA